MVAWSIDALAGATTVGAIVVVAPAGAEEQVEAAATSTVDFSTVGVENSTVGVAVVVGGATRAESVAAALERVETELVVVHDAARPLVTPSLVDAVVRKLADRPNADGVIAAAPLTDTVKRAHEPRPANGEVPRGGPTIAKTESRDHLWAAQTPQAFRTAALREAYDADPQRIAAATDEAMLVERAGGKVLIEPAPAWNLKVTTPEDLRVADLLLSDR